MTSSGQTYGYCDNVTILGQAGNDTIINDGKNSLLSGGADRDSIFNGGSSVTVDGGDGNDYIDNNTTVSASNVYNVSIAGGAGSDTLRGGEGSDSLSGGFGNDSLSGGAGSDVFIYKPNEGKDKIMDFTGSDMLQILKANGSQGTFTNSSFKSGKLTLAVSGGGHVVFSGVSKSDTFNINGTIHKISGTKLK